jgi:hypothetical protein
MSTFCGKRGLANGIRGCGSISGHASMIHITPHMQILVAVEPAHKRKGIDGRMKMAPHENGWESFYWVILLGHFIGSFYWGHFIGW